MGKKGVVGKDELRSYGKKEESVKEENGKGRPEGKGDESGKRVRKEGGMRRWR